MRFSLCNDSAWKVTLPLTVTPNVSGNKTLFRC